MGRVLRVSNIFSILLLSIASLACQAVYRLPEALGLLEPTSFASTGELLYLEDFSDNSRGWDVETSSDDFGKTNKNVVDGKYRISLSSEMGFLFDITSIPEFSGADYLLVMDVSVIALQASPGDLSLQFSLREVDGVNGKHYAFDFNTGLPTEGALVVPLDINANGLVDPEENYPTKQAAVNAVSLNHYPSPPARELNLVTKGHPTGITQVFITWILMDGQQFLQEMGYIGLSQEKLAVELTKLEP